jgi:hypothetical protein
VTKANRITQDALVFVARRAWTRTVQLDGPTVQRQLFKKVVLHQGARKVSDRAVNVEIPGPKQLQVGRCGTGALVSVHYEVRSKIPDHLRNCPGLG